MHIYTRKKEEKKETFHYRCESTWSHPRSNPSPGRGQILEGRKEGLKKNQTWKEELKKNQAWMKGGER
jgi:hypothetical protein